MIEESNMVWPAEWPKWVIKILNEMEETEKPAGEWCSEGAPEWVHTLERELFKVSMPAMKLEGPLESGPRFLGKMLGQYELMLNGDHSLEYQFENVEKVVDKLNESIKAKLNKKAYKRLLEKGKKYNPDFIRFAKRLELVVAAKQKCIAEARETAEQQFDAEKADFLKGFSEGFSTPIYDKDNRLVHEKLTTNIYLLMFVYWRRVREFPSTVVLYQWLTTLLGKQVIGSLDRIRRICVRIRLKLRPCGRPRK
ncbi:MAG: hypothetical protein A2283_20940 [Lentisphaerae bacterium RIFOXYA12_FULL_48_11]|nr:MAG: hypothetical protein A2283_20940 [Lentisphaerae bacterium RIFOXYA12_FULL_48_11]